VKVNVYLERFPLFVPDRSAFSTVYDLFKTKKAPKWSGRWTGMLEKFMLYTIGGLKRLQNHVHASKTKETL
jgi:hypothetical protein